MLKNKKVTIIFIIMLSIVLLFDFYFVSQMIKPIDEDNEKEDLPIDNRQYTIKLKHDSNGNICESISCNDEYQDNYIIKTETKDAKFLTIDNNKRFVLIEDNGLKIYDLYKETTNSVNYNKYKDFKNIYIYSDLEKVYALMFETKKDSDTENNYTVYYDYINQKVIKETETSNGYFINKDYLEKSDLETTSLIDIKSNKEILKDDFKDGVRVNYKVYDTNNNIYFHEYCASEYPCSKLYTKDGKEIIDLIPGGQFTVYDGYLYVIYKDEIKKYDSKGTLINSNKDYKNILGINNKYILINENNKLILIDYLTKEKTEIMDWKEEYQNLDWEYYSKNIFKVKEIKSGSYLTFYDKSFNQFCYYYSHENNEVEKLNCK